MVLTQEVPVGIVNLDAFGEVLDLVPAECQVSAPVQPAGDFHASREFYSHPVAVFDIGSEGFADFADLAGQDQLVAVIHEVKIGADMETGVSETVTRFIVVERLVLRAFVRPASVKLSRFGSRLATENETNALWPSFWKLMPALGLKKFQCLSTFTWSSALSSLPSIV